MNRYDHPAMILGGPPFLVWTEYASKPNSKRTLTELSVNMVCDRVNYGIIADMNFRKLWKCLSAAALAVSLGACTQEKKARNVQDGTYTGSAEGYGGDVSTEVTFRDGAITEIQIVSQHETQTLSDSALKNIPKYIVSEQSTDVDVSTGATVTSKAIQSAVKDAITQAGGNPEEWNEDATGKHQDKLTRKKAQAVVIGGGVAGAAATLRLQQLGVDTIIVEKSAKLGGSMRLGTHFTQLVTGAEVTDDAESPAESTAGAISDIYAYGNEKGSEELLDVMADHIADTVTWQVRDLGIHFAEKWAITNEYDGNAVRSYASSDGAIGDLLARECDVSGAEILSETCVYGLRYEGDQVIGVIAKKSDGTVVEITADYVVIASGSYAGSDALLTEGDAVLPYAGITSDTGDMYVFAKDKEYLVSEDGESVITALSIALSEEEAADTYSADQSVMKSGLLIVNADGNRFVNESYTRNNVSESVQAQTDGAYLVMSDEAYTAWKEKMLEENSFSKEDQQLLQDDELPGIFHGATLAEAADGTGINTEQLFETVTAFNAYADMKDTADEFGRTAFGEVDPEKSCHIVRLVSAVYETTAGIQADTDLRVMRADGTSISNLYVVGSACGNVFGDRIADGAATAWAFVSGKTAADHIAESNS